MDCQEKLTRFLLRRQRWYLTRFSFNLGVTDIVPVKRILHIYIMILSKMTNGRLLRSSSLVCTSLFHRMMLEMGDRHSSKNSVGGWCQQESMMVLQQTGGKYSQLAVDRHWHQVKTEQPAASVYQKSPDG